MQIFAARVMKLREQSGLTQEEVAKKLGISRQALDYGRKR